MQNYGGACENSLINTVAATSEERCFLLYLKEKKIFTGKKKKKERAGLGHKQAIRCSASLLRHKALPGAEESQREPKTCLGASPPLPIKFSKPSSAPQTAQHFPEQGGWCLPSTLKKYMSVRVPFATRPSAFVSYGRCAEEGRCRCGASSSPARHRQGDFPGPAPPPRDPEPLFCSAAKLKAADAFPVFTEFVCSVR